MQPRNGRASSSALRLRIDCDIYDRLIISSEIVCYSQDDTEHIRFTLNREYVRGRRSRERRRLAMAEIPVIGRDSAIRIRRCCCIKANGQRRGA